MATGRTYPIKKSAVKAYGYTKPPKKRASGSRMSRNGGVTHIAAINGRGAYNARTRMAGLSKNQRSAAARSSLTAAKKAAFARKMRSIKSGALRRNSGDALKKPELQRKIRKTKLSYSSASAQRSVGGASAHERRVNQHWRRAFGRSGPTKYAKNPRIKRTLPGYSANKSKFRKNNTAAYHLRADAALARRSASPPSRFASARAHERAREARIDLASGMRKPKKKSRRRVGPARRGTTKKSASTKGTTMARKVRRKKKSAARKPVRRVKRRKASKKRSAVAPKRRVKRRKAKKSATAVAPKRRRRRKAKKTTLKANRKRRSRRLKRNYGTKRGAKRGWKTRKARYAPSSFRKRSKRRKAKAGAPKRRRGKRKLSQSKSARAARKRYRAKKSGLKPNRRRRVRRNARKATPNRRRRSSRRKMRSNRRRHRRNGRRSMFRKNGIMDPIVTVLKTGAIALGGFGAHKVISNLFTTQVLNRIFGAPATVVVTPAATTAVAPATSGLGGLNVDPQYQRLAGSFLVAALGVYATTKLVKDQATRNTLITGMSVSFAHTIASALLAKFAPQYAGILAGPEDGTAARLSAMYGMRGLGAGGTSIMPNYAPINGMGEYFSSGVNGLGEYFSSGVNGLGEYFSSGVSGLGAYQAAAGYGANPDMAEAAAGYGSSSIPGNHVDPHGDLDRELNIAEAAAGVGGMGAVQSYEASAGFGSVSSLPSSSTWIPGSSDPQLWAGTRSISSPQSASEMVPAGILQTDGGQGVFG